MYRRCASRPDRVRQCAVVTVLRAVLWDMDGTLLDSEKLWDVAVHESAARLGGRLTQAQREAMVGATGPAALAMLFAAVGVDPTTRAVAEACDWLDRRVMELFATEVSWRPGAKDGLSLVRSLGLAAALVTNTKRVLTEPALDVIGRDYFDATVCGDEVAFGKPAPDPYLRAAELLGVAPSECVVIEDSPTGAAAAQAAGCALIVVPCEFPVPAAAGRMFRDSLVGMTRGDLDRALALLADLRQ
jgi:HAD superfamily hydrolase (TIGR01509 family)